ncbi:MAG TPA: hypothetical protein VN368_02800 [Candidatus Methylomirabilis sp.]|nr:hypothetical protein [Candidatus Methylomirabilis sp.]
MMILNLSLMLKIQNGEKVQVIRKINWVKKRNVGEVLNVTTKFGSKEFTKVRIVNICEKQLKEFDNEDVVNEGLMINDKCRQKFVDKIYARIVCNKCMCNDSCYQFNTVKINKGTWNPDAKKIIFEFEKVFW